MKILIVSEMSVPYVVGGGEVRYDLLANEFVRRGHEVTWLSMRQRGSPDTEIVAGVRHLHRGPRIHSPPVRPVLSMLRFMFTAFFHVLTHRYDVVDAQTYAPLPPVWLACLLSGKRMIATIHDVSRSDKGQWMSDRFLRATAFAEAFLYRLPYATIVAVSESTSRALISRWGVARTRIRVVQNGIEPLVQHADGDEAREIDLIFAGRFVPTKNIEDLIEVARTCRASGKLRRAVLVGDGPLHDEMAERVRLAGLSDVIELAGRKSNVEVLALLRRAKVFFHASSREGFPVVMVEALSCGVPVVGYRVPGVVDVIDDETNGILVTERDTEAHARACMRLLDSTELRSRLAAAGKSKVAASLTVTKMADGVLEAYAGA